MNKNKIEVDQVILDELYKRYENLYEENKIQSAQLEQYQRRITQLMAEKEYLERCLKKYESKGT